MIIKPTTPKIYTPRDPSCVLDLSGRDVAGAKIYDRSGKGNHGTIYGAFLKPSNYGMPALQFDGVDDYVDAGNSASLNITDAITIEAWIYLNSGAGIGYIIAKNSLSTADSQYGIYWEATNKRVNGLLEGVSTGNSADNSIRTGRWNHVIMRYDKTDVRYYINGILSGTPFAKTDSITASDFTVNIGRRKPSDYIFNGKIDEVRIYNRALSASEISEMYNRIKNLFGK